MLLETTLVYCDDIDIDDGLESSLKALLKFFKSCSIYSLLLNMESSWVLPIKFYYILSESIYWVVGFDVTAE